MDAGRLPVDEQVAAFQATLDRKGTLTQVLARAAAVDLPGWHLVAGCLSQTVHAVFTRTGHLRADQKELCQPVNRSSPHMRLVGCGAVALPHLYLVTCGRRVVPVIGQPWHVRPEGSRFRAPERAAKLVWMLRLPCGAARFHNLFPITEHTR